MLTEYWWLAVTLIGVLAIYFVWGRKLGTKSEGEQSPAAKS